eukprot:8805745-Karenia_brevis.AAC.1
MDDDEDDDYYDGDDADDDDNDDDADYDDDWSGECSIAFLGLLCSIPQDIAVCTHLGATSHFHLLWTLKA